MKWLTARSSYTFTPKENPMKLDATTQAQACSILELPNVYFVDYQGLAMRSLTGKDNQGLEGRSLDAISKFMFKDDDSILGISKVPQNIIQLQRVCHEQMSDCHDRFDMTQIMKYSINDTVMLYRMEQRRNLMLDFINASAEAFNVSMHMAITFTSNQINQLSISRILDQRGQMYRIQHVDPDYNGRISGAYTNIPDDYLGQVTQNVHQFDFASLYPSCIIAFNIGRDSFVGTTSNPSPYSDRTQFAVIDISDDTRYRCNPKQTYAVFSHKERSVMATVCMDLTNRRGLHKKLMAEAEKRGDKQQAL